MTPANPADSPKSMSPNAQAIPPTQADPSPLARALVEAQPRRCGGDRRVSSSTATTLAELLGALAAAL